MNRTVRNAVRRSRINSEYFCRKKGDTDKKEKGQKMTYPPTPEDDTLTS